MKETYRRKKAANKYIVYGDKITNYFHDFVNKKESLIMSIRLIMIKALDVMIISKLRTMSLNI